MLDSTINSIRPVYALLLEIYDLGIAGMIGAV